MQGRSNTYASVEAGCRIVSDICAGRYAAFDRRHREFIEKLARYSIDALKHDWLGGYSGTAAASTAVGAFSDASRLTLHTTSARYIDAMLRAATFLLLTDSLCQREWRAFLAKKVRRSPASRAGRRCLYRAAFIEDTAVGIGLYESEEIRSLQ